MYDQIAKTVKQSVARRLDKIEHVQKTEQYNPETGKMDINKVINIRRGFLGRFSVEYTAGTTIQAGDVNIVLINGEKVNVSDILKHRGKEYTVIGISGRDASGATISYHCR